MLKLALVLAAIFSVSSTSYAQVVVQEAGDVSYYDITRTIFRGRSKACYTISHIANGLKISCVTVKIIPSNLPATQNLAKITYGKLMQVIDSDLGVHCVGAAHIGEGVDITCSAN